LSSDIRVHGEIFADMKVDDFFVM